MTTLIDNRVGVVATSHARYFYFYMALACIAVAFLGFAPTYWLPLASGSFSSTPVVHFHGLLFSHGRCISPSRPGSPRPDGPPGTDRSG